MTPEEHKQLQELEELHRQFALLADRALGMFVTDNGYVPSEVVQARVRFYEAKMWLKTWIERTYK